MRSSAFVYCFFVLGLHGWERELGLPFWIVLALSFLVYPHLLLLRALRAREPRKAELQNVFMDPVLFGLWSAALHFPTWVAYAALSSVTLNAITARGVPGALLSFGLFAAGAAAWVAMFGFQYWPATSELVSTLCFFGALGYTLAVGFVVYAQSQRLRAARDELRAEGARYRLVTENASDLIGIVDADARWLYCSPSYSGVLDPSDLAAGADAFRRAHPADADRGRAEVLRAAADGRPRELDVRLDGRGGTRQFRMRLSPLDGPGPRRVLLVSQDVTQLREAEERLRRSTMSHGDQARR